MRDLFMGKRTYSEFQQSPEKIPSNILAERLKRLMAHELIGREAYQEKPVRYAYQLTDRGRSLWPVMKAIMQWGNEQIPGTYDTTEFRERE